MKSDSYRYSRESIDRNENILTLKAAKTSEINSGFLDKIHQSATKPCTHALTTSNVGL
eukprot:m.161971 g.161971  ORF g.161971 m.161971 type:complete len:58 (+) comp16386_c3_seq1:381-554(+)